MDSLQEAFLVVLGYSSFTIILVAELFQEVLGIPHHVLVVLLHLYLIGSLRSDGFASSHARYNCALVVKLWLVKSALLSDILIDIRFFVINSNFLVWYINAAVKSLHLLTVQGCVVLLMDYFLAAHSFLNFLYRLILG